SSAWAFSLFRACASSWLSQKPGSRLSASISSERRRFWSTSKAPPERLEALGELFHSLLHITHSAVLPFPTFPRETIAGVLSFEPAFVDPFRRHAAIPRQLRVQVLPDGLAEDRRGGASTPPRLLLHGLRDLGRHAHGEDAGLGELDLELLQGGREPGD